MDPTNQNLGFPVSTQIPRDPVTVGIWLWTRV